MNQDSSIQDGTLESNIIKKKRGRKPKIKPVDEVVEIKEQKKRGRKPKPKSQDNIEIKVHKKRGRKPKPKPVEEEVKIPKKRGRKPKEKYGLVDTESILSPNTEENIILHLPIKVKNICNGELIEDKFLRYNPQIVIPEPYESSDKNTIISPYPFNISPDTDLTDNNKQINNNIGSIKMDISKPRTQVLKSNLIIETNKTESYDKLLEDLNQSRSVEINTSENNKSRNSLILLEYSESNKNKTWPNSIKIDCLWCCHPFSNFPFALPMKYINNKFYVFGNFCSPECAAAYNFESNEESDEIWDRYSLLNILYKKDIDGAEVTIKLAPPRLTLRKFGGKLTIDEFRNCNLEYNKDFKITLPPMISIIPSMEESNYDMIKKKRFVPLDRERIHKANEELRLKRKKPLPDSRNTLESCMRLKYV